MMQSVFRHNSVINSSVHSPMPSSIQNWRRAWDATIVQGQERREFSSISSVSITIRNRRCRHSELLLLSTKALNRGPTTLNDSKPSSEQMPSSTASGNNPF
ncbi:unnamed protein product [Ixodes persulcatus]